VNVTAEDPRVERTRRAALEGALDELAEHGYGAFTIEGVARRAGVGKATIYRHWDGKLDLLQEAIATLKQQSERPFGADLRANVLAKVQAVAETVASTRFGACMPAIIDASERDVAVREFHHRTSADRRASMVALLQTACDAGHLDDSVDVGILGEMMVGPIMLRRLMTDAPYTAEEVDRLVATVLDPYWRDV